MDQATETAATRSNVVETALPEGGEIEGLSDLARDLVELARAEQTPIPAEPEPQVQPGEQAKTLDDPETDVPDEAAEDAAEETPETPPGVQRRIDKAVRKQREAEEKARELEERIREIEAKAAKPEEKADEMPITAATPEIQQLENAEQKYLDGLQEVDQLMARSKSDPESVAQRLAAFNLPVGDGSAEALSATLRTVERNLTWKLQDVRTQKAVQTAQWRQQYQQTQSQARSIVQTVYPWALNPRSQEALLHAQILRQVPELKRFPEAELAVADMVAGKVARLKTQQAAKDGVVLAKPLVKPPPVAGGAVSAQAKTDPRKAQLAAAQARLDEEGSPEALASVLRLM